MQQSPSWEANLLTASQEIPQILWNPKFHYCIYKCPPRNPILSQINPGNDPTSHSSKSILILSSHLCLGLWNGIFPSGFPTKTLYRPLLSPHMLHAPPTSSFWIWSPKQYWVRSLSSSLCSFLHSSVTSTLLGPNIIPRTLFLKPSAYIPPSMWATKFPTHKNNGQKVSYVYLNI